MIDRSREERIRQEAFMLLNADGRPEGEAEAYWLKAEKIIDDMDRRTQQEAKRGDL